MKTVPRASGQATKRPATASVGITDRLPSATWDPWRRLQEYREHPGPKGGIYTLRRITPEDRQLSWPLD